MNEKELEFARAIKNIKKLKGTGTQLVSVYITPNYPIGEIANKIRSEISQAENIKSKQTRTKVIGALERILQALKSFRETPPNGLVIFAGDVSEDPSKEDIITITLEPIYKLNQSIYRCDSSFYVEPLEQMLNQKESYGLVVMDGKEATLAILRGVNFTILETIESHAHSKVRKGGQSARRYERLIEEQTEYYYKKVAEAMDNHFLNKVKGVIIGGPGPTKEYFVESKFYNYQHNILGIVNTGYTDIEGIRELIENSKDILKEQDLIVEKREFENFVKKLIKEEKATYGMDSVIEAIKNRRAEKVLISTKIDYEPIIELCKQNGIEFVLISDESIEGNQFLNTFTGIGAILKY